MGNVIRDAVDIRRGRQRAEADIKIAEAFEANHHAHHAADPSWQGCVPESAAFYRGAELRAQSYNMKPLEAAAYSGTLTEWRDAKTAARAADGDSPVMNMTLVEMDGTETPQDFVRKVMESIHTDEKLKALNLDSDEGLDITGPEGEETPDDKQ